MALKLWITDLVPAAWGFIVEQLPAGPCHVEVALFEDFREGRARQISLSKKKMPNAHFANAHFANAHFAFPHFANAHFSIAHFANALSFVK